MAIELGQGIEKIVYTGKANMEILCVNPTLEESIKFNLPGKKDSEPEYMVTNNNGEKSFMLKFWLKSSNPEFVAPLTFFLQDKNDLSSQKQSQMFINNFGAFGYADSLEDILNRSGNYFKPDGARNAKVGEAYLTNFLIKLFCTQTANIENFSKLANGDLTEIKKYISMLPKGRCVQVLLYEKNGYMQVYSKRFERYTSTSSTYWESYFEKEKQSGKSIPNYQDSFSLKKWDPIQPDQESEDIDNPQKFNDLFK